MWQVSGFSCGKMNEIEKERPSETVIEARIKKDGGGREGQKGGRVG